MITNILQQYRPLNASTHVQVEGISYCPTPPQTEDDLESLTPDTLQERATTEPENVFFSLFSGEGADGAEADSTFLVR
jgi:hypothetical protein